MKQRQPFLSKPLQNFLINQGTERLSRFAEHLLLMP